MVICALPLVSVAAAEVYVPLLNVTEPVGVGLPLPPLTATVTASDCATVILDAAGVTVTVGVTTVATKLAVTVILPFNVTLQVTVVAVVQPVHEEKVLPFAVVGAVSVIDAPES